MKWIVKNHNGRTLGTVKAPSHSIATYAAQEAWDEQVATVIPAKPVKIEVADKLTIITVRMTHIQREQLKREAKAADLSLQKYCMKKLFNDK